MEGMVSGSVYVNGISFANIYVVIVRSAGESKVYMYDAITSIYRSLLDDHLSKRKVCMKCFSSSPKGVTSTKRIINGNFYWLVEGKIYVYDTVCPVISPTGNDYGTTWV